MDQINNPWFELVDATVFTLYTVLRGSRWKFTVYTVVRGPRWKFAGNKRTEEGDGSSRLIAWNRVDSTSYCHKGQILVSNCMPSNLQDHKNFGIPIF